MKVLACPGSIRIKVAGERSSLSIAPPGERFHASPVDMILAQEVTEQALRALGARPSATDLRLLRDERVASPLLLQDRS